MQPYLSFQNSFRPAFYGANIFKCFKKSRCSLELLDLAANNAVKEFLKYLEAIIKY